MRKKVMSVLLVMVLALSSMSVLASEEFVGNGGVEGTIDLRQLSQEDDVTISEVMTFDELIDTIAKDKGIPVSQVKKEFLANQANTNNSTLSESELLAELRAQTFRTIRQSVPVTSKYQAQVSWYVETSESQFYWGIVKIINTTLIRSYNGLSKQFEGDLYTHLQSANQFYWYLNGDFYNNGTTTESGFIQIGIGKFFSINYTVSNSSNHYGYVWHEDTFSIY